MKPRFLTVESDKSFVRDTSSNGIVHNNHDEYLKYLEEKEKRIAKDRRINKLESEVQEMKALLTKLLEQK